METIAAAVLASLLLAPSGNMVPKSTPANRPTLSAAAVREARSMAQLEAPRPASPARVWVSNHPVGTAALVGAVAACLPRSAAFGASAGISVGTLAGYVVSFARR